MATELKAIETVYNGYRFRSRLEARWAVFFDALGVFYEYEKEGFDLGEAGWYLPDFWIPSWDMWIEVKPVTQTYEAYSKVWALTEMTNKSCMMLAGSPWPQQHIIHINHPGEQQPCIKNLWCHYNLNNTEECTCDCFSEFGQCRRCDGICLYIETENMQSMKNIGKHTCGDHDRWPLLCDIDNRIFISNLITEAYTKARCADFVGKRG